MSQALFNLSFSLPFPSNRTRNSGTFQFFTPCTSFNKFNVVKALAAGESRDNLDNLQRAKSNLPPTQPKKRVAPVPPIGLWDRFPTARTVQQMMETMERLMDDPFAYSGTWPSPLTSETGGYNSRGRTPWEIKEGENEYNMRFDMPGMTKKDVKVWVEEKMLVINAEKVPEKKETQVNDGNNNYNNEVEGGGGEWSAKSYGRYSSRIALPENIQFEKITAEVKDGVLYVKIPKASQNVSVLDINVQ